MTNVPSLRDLVAHWIVFCTLDLAWLTVDKELECAFVLVVDSQFQGKRFPIYPFQLGELFIKLITIVVGL